MAHVHDEQFDFMDENDTKKNKKINPKKNPTQQSNYNDLYDLDQEPNGFKLPILNSKPKPNLQGKNLPSYSTANLQDIDKKKASKTSLKKLQTDQEDQEYEQSIAKSPAHLKEQLPVKKIEKKQQIAAKQTEKEEQGYGEQFEAEQNYQEDFQVHESQKIASPVVKRQEKKPQLNIPKVVKQSNNQRASQSVTKRHQPLRQASKNSARSLEKARTISRGEEKKEQTSNKFTSLAEKTCPNYEKASLSSFNPEKLVRQNDKIRGLIKRFNDELNEMINRNIIQLKGKKDEKVVDVENDIRILEQQKSNNEAAYLMTSKQLQKLKGKEGEIKEEEYHLSLQQKIEESKALINELTKASVKLKTEINNQGNKLSKMDKEKNVKGNQNSILQDINNIKTTLANCKKDQEKNDDLMKKLELKLDDFNKKITEVDNRYNSCVEEAKQKGISIQINPQLTKKSEDIRKKIEIAKLHKTKTQSLLKTKADMIVHQCDQLKNQIKLIINSTLTTANHCEQVQNQSKKTVEKTKKNSKIPQDLISNLESIITEMESATPASKQGKDEPGAFSHPKGAKKYQSQKNVEKVNIVNKVQEKEDISNKQTIFKRKETQQQKLQQRIWTDKKIEEKIQKIQKPTELNTFEDRQAKKDEERKKPFQIKKKQIKVVESQIVQPASIGNGELLTEIKHQSKQSIEKNEETINIAPRMMKFKRNKQDQVKPEEPKVPSNDKNIEIPQQNPIAQQSFIPKRFSLRLKDKKSPEEVAYVATAIGKEQPKARQQYKPKGIVADQESLNMAEVRDPMKIPAFENQQQKPKINLRLKDRHRQSNKPGLGQQYLAQLNKQAEPKFTINLNDSNGKVQNVISKQNNNPYANSANQTSKRQREGPLKKQKVTQIVQKAGLSIYDQAEDLVNVKQISIKNEGLPNRISQQPDLQKMLGIHKSKNTIDDDLLVDTKILGKGGKKQAKNDTNFFGDLQL